MLSSCVLDLDAGAGPSGQLVYDLGCGVYQGKGACKVMKQGGHKAEASGGRLGLVLEGSVYVLIQGALCQECADPFTDCISGLIQADARGH